MNYEIEDMLRRAGEFLRDAAKHLDEASRHKGTSEKHWESIGAAKWSLGQALALHEITKTKKEAA